MLLLRNVNTGDQAPKQESRYCSKAAEVALALALAGPLLPQGGGGVTCHSRFRGKARARRRAEGAFPQPVVPGSPQSPPGRASPQLGEGPLVKDRLCPQPRGGRRPKVSGDAMGGIRGPRRPQPRPGCRGHCFCPTALCAASLSRGDFSPSALLTVEMPKGEASSTEGTAVERQRLQIIICASIRKAICLHPKATCGQGTQVADQTSNLNT
ncbi:hypothetical protein P7K49_012269 [Saguinus oedipus]|uniref:Uncharacterized protein n=1 Tax=Saguinus oedipus TaxID=9490 RepID=A0ABQ9VWK2_SAGOE|nr:hypothetical protein P7K49_012269 [Saguinus oedipus]